MGLPEKITLESSVAIATDEYGDTVVGDARNWL